MYRKRGEGPELTRRPLVTDTIFVLLLFVKVALLCSVNLPATWIVSSEKPSKLRCIQTTSTEMGDSASANPGNHCYIDSRKGDSH
jgi:hypothetical protein